MADELKVELEISDDLASAKLSNFNRVLDATERKINDTGKSSAFAKNFGVQFDEIEKKAEKTRKALAEVTSQRIVGGNFDGVTQSLIRAQNESTKLRARLAEIKSAIETTPSGKTSLLKIMAEDARAVELELAKIERLQQRLETKHSDSKSGAKSNGSDFVPGLADSTGLPLGFAAAGAAIGYGVGKFSSDIVEAARIAEDSNRVLLATAKETGIAYDQLSAKAKKFGELTGQSTSAATSTFASITQFAQQAGRTNEIDKFTQSLADLAAARGISAEQLPDMLTQLKTGQDEVFDKLKGANPSKFYDEYARSIGKTAESLTDLEKSQVRFDVILKSGLIFSGEAEKRMIGLSGKLDTFSAKWDNFYARAGTASAPFWKAQLDNAIAFFDFVEGKQKKVLTLAEEIERQTKRAEEAAKQLREQEVSIREAKANPTANLKNSALANINILDNFFDPAERQKQIDAAIMAATEQAEAYKNSLTKAIQGARGDLSFLKILQKDFQANSFKFDLDTRFQISEQLKDAISNGVSKGFNKLLQNKEATVQSLKKGLADIFASPDLTKDARESLTQSFTERIKQAVDSGKAKVRDLEKTFLSISDNLASRAGANNPFVAIFAEGDKAIHSLRENTRGLSKDLISVFEQMEQKQQQIQLFNARLDSALTAFDLRESASSFRNDKPKDFGLVQKEFFDKVVKRASGLNDISGLSATEKREFYERNLLAGSFGFNQLTQDSVVSSLARDRKPAEENINLSLQERLQKQFDIIEKLRNTSQLAETGSAADKRIIALTSGVNPNELTTEQRIQAAAARERQADRTEKSEQEATRLRAETLEVQKKIALEITKLREVAEKDGLIGLQVLFKDAETGAARDLTPSPTSRDVAEAFGGTSVSPY